MSSGSLKRSIPGGDATNGSSEIDLTDQQVGQLEEAQKLMKRAEIHLTLHELKFMEPTFTKRREILKDIPTFWPTALQNNKHFAIYSQHASDKDALSHLEDMWIVRDKVEPRAFTVEFHFKQNPYFANKVLCKEFKYAVPPNADTSVESDGLTAGQVDFDYDRDLEPQTCTVDWTNDSKNLVKLYPRKVDPEDEEDVHDLGSFFNWFTEASDPFQVMDAILAVYDDPIEHFYGRAGEGEDEDLTDSEEENDDAADEEIDLEKPKKKARKA